MIDRDQIAALLRQAEQGLADATRVLAEASRLLEEVTEHASAQPGKPAWFRPAAPVDELREARLDARKTAPSGKFRCYRCQGEIGVPTTAGTVRCVRCGALHEQG